MRAVLSMRAMCESACRKASDLIPIKFSLRARASPTRNAASGTVRVLNTALKSLLSNRKPEGVSWQHEHELKTLVNIVFSLKNLSCMSVHAIRISDVMSK